MIRISFSQIDSWCFREARPMGAIGGTSIESVFPPPSSTIIGAVRTLIGDLHEVNWHQFSRGNAQELNTLLGDSCNTGALNFSFPYLQIRRSQSEDLQRLYPVPSILLRSDNKLIALKFSEKTTQCDLGNVVLPSLPDLGRDLAGAKPLENAWLTQQGFNQVLKGEVPDHAEVIELEQLLTKETRLGIARNNALATVEQGALFQADHLRFSAEFDVEIAVEMQAKPNVNIDDTIGKLLNNQYMVRLGGEGRLASVHSETIQVSTEHSNNLPQQGLLMLTSPGDFAGWLLPNFQAIEIAGQTCWQGQIADIDVVVKGFCGSKSLKLGGWDSALRQPKPVRSLVPAGACYYIECQQPEQLSKRLKLAAIGENTDFGFGQLCYFPLLK